MAYTAVSYLCSILYWCCVSLCQYILSCSSMTFLYPKWGKQIPGVFHRLQALLYFLCQQNKKHNPYGQNIDQQTTSVVWYLGKFINRSASMGSPVVPHSPTWVFEISVPIMKMSVTGMKGGGINLTLTYKEFFKTLTTIKKTWSSQLIKYLDFGSETYDCYFSNGLVLVPLIRRMGE